MIPSNGIAQSGGIDIFASGSIRAVEEGGQVGVHSWCCTDEGLAANEISEDDPAHGVQLTYFREMLGDQLGEEFYFFTINAADFDDMYFMTQEELARFLVTE